jgi:RHS repeat-associated protein
MIKGGVNFRFITDPTGSVRLVVNAATGAVVQRLDYDAFGNVLADTNPGFQPFGFAGGLYDRDTGLVRFGVRDYDAKIGRWTAKDPAGYADRGTNLYAYVHGDPVNRIDPAGNDDVSVAVPEQSIDADAVIGDVIQILSADPVFVDKTDSVFKYGPRPGDVRNGLLVACNILSGSLLCDTLDPFAAYYVCSSIADYADQVLKNAIAEGKLPNVASAESRGRRGVLGTDHQALFLTLNDGTTVVLDWHSTLDAQHPLVSTPEEWCMGNCL